MWYNKTKKWRLQVIIMNQRCIQKFRLLEANAFEGGA